MEPNTRARQRLSVPLGVGPLSERARTGQAVADLINGLRTR
jgi:hypothetical protein